MRSARPKDTSGRSCRKRKRVWGGSVARLTLARVTIQRSVLLDGVRLRVTEEGDGPLVLLSHGFPETAYSWRWQLPALAAAGYQAVAVDVRGYGRSSKPVDVAEYRMTRLVNDNVALVHALGADTAAIIGHDWGSPIAANSALLAADVFTSVAMLSVPYAPRGGPRPTEVFAQIGEGADFYVSYFQLPGVIEAEIEPDVGGWLRGFYTSLSGDTMPVHGSDAAFFVAPGTRMSDGFTTGNLPAWLSEADLDVYAGDFERSGFSGGLNRYRNVDRDWRISLPTTECPSRSPRCSSEVPGTPRPPGTS